MRGNKNKLVICIYLYIYVPLLQAHHQGPLENSILVTLQTGGLQSYSKQILLRVYFMDFDQRLTWRI